MRLRSVLLFAVGCVLMLVGFLLFVGFYEYVVEWMADGVLLFILGFAIVSTFIFPVWQDSYTERRKRPPLAAGFPFPQWILPNVDEEEGKRREEDEGASGLAED